MLFDMNEGRFDLARSHAGLLVILHVVPCFPNLILHDL